MAKTTKKQEKPEKITEVSVYNGRETAMLVRELDPDKNRIVVHAVRKGSYAHERMHQTGMIDGDMFKAGERFRMDFERGHLRGYFAKLDMNRTSGGGQKNLTDGILQAKRKAIEALKSLGAKRDGSASLSGSLVWHVIGEGCTLEDWARRQSWCGGPSGFAQTIGGNVAIGLGKSKASGILLAALERLAFHYGYIDQKDIKDRSAKRGFAEGIKAAVTFAHITAGNNDTAEAHALRKFSKDLEKRYIKSQG